MPLLSRNVVARAWPNFLLKIHIWDGILSKPGIYKILNRQMLNNGKKGCRTAAWRHQYNLKLSLPGLMRIFKEAQLKAANIAR